MGDVLLKLPYTEICPTLLINHFSLETRRFYVNEMMGTVGASEERLGSCILHPVRKS